MAASMLECVQIFCLRILAIAQLVFVLTWLWRWTQLSLMGGEGLDTHTVLVCVCAWHCVCGTACFICRLTRLEHSHLSLLPFLPFFLLFLAQVLMQGHDEGELWGLAVHPSTNNFVTASCDKTIRTWSLSTKVCFFMTWQLNLNACACLQIASKSAFNGLSLHNNISATVHAMTKWFVLFCSAQDGEFADINCLVF